MPGCPKTGKEMRTWVGVPLAQGRKCVPPVRSAFFLSPLCGEVLRSPADMGADRLAGSFPRSAQSLYLFGTQRVTGNRIRKAYQGAFGPVRSRGERDGF